MPIPESSMVIINLQISFLIIVLTLNSMYPFSVYLTLLFKMFVNASFKLIPSPYNSSGILWSILVLNFNSLFLHKSLYILTTCFNMFLILYLLLYTLIVEESICDISNISFVMFVNLDVLDFISLAVS